MRPLLAPTSRPAVSTAPGPRARAVDAPEFRSTRLDRRLHSSYRLWFRVRAWFWRHVTPAGGLLFWAMLAAGSFTDIASTMAHELFGLLFCLLVGAVIWLRKPRRHFALQRSLPRFASVGTAFQYAVRIQNLSARRQRGREYWEGLPDPRPTLREFVHLEEPQEGRRNWFDRRYRFYRWRWLCGRNTRARPRPMRIPPIPPRGTVVIRQEVLPLRRGRLTFSRAEIGRTDPFGLLRRLVTAHDQAESVTVFPRRFRLPPVEFPGHSDRLQSGGVALAGSVGDSEEFVSVREYRPGDPLRHIHWAGWARTQRPVVKEFQEEFFVRHALLLDTFGGGPEADAFEDAVSLAASLACTIDDRDTLLDLMFIGEQAYVFTAGRGVAHGEQMLEILAGVELVPEGRFLNLESLVLRHTARLSGCLLILLGWDNVRRGLRERLEAGGIPTLTFVVHRDPPPLDVLPPRVHWLNPGAVEETLAKLAL